MATLSGIFLLTSLSIVLLMTFLSAGLYFYYKERRTLHMLEHWASYSSYFLLSYLTNHPQEEIVSLSMLCWFWRVKTIRQLLEDISRTTLRRNWHKFLLWGGLVLWLVGMFLDFSFSVFTMPVCLTIFIVGADMVRGSYQVVKNRRRPLPYYAFLLVNFLTFLHMLNYPFMRDNQVFAVYGFTIALIILFTTAVMLPSIMLLELTEEHAEHLEELVERRTQQLINQSKFSALGEMAAGIAHEVNNPLSVISGKASQLQRHLLKGETEKEKMRLGLELIETTAFRISKIIKGLKDFSRNSENVPMKKVSLPLIVSETMDLCRERFTHHGVNLKVNEIPAIDLYCRSIQISQVLLNLLNNAFDAVMESDNKDVELLVESFKDKVVIRVVDSGKGIPHEIKSRIMVPFFTTKEVGKGTGIGLSISKGIVEDHQGKFYLDDASSRTCFVVELPQSVTG